LGGRFTTKKCDVCFFPDGFVDGIYQLISMMDSMEIHDGPKTGLVDGFHSAPWNYEKLPWNLLGKIHDPSDFGAPFPFFVGLSFLKERSLCVSRSASI